MRASAGARLAALGTTAAWYLGVYYIPVALIGPSRPRALSLLQRWSRHACGLLNLSVQIHGRPHPAPCIYLSNHRSYLDIPLLSAALGASFFSRADVAGWPVFGRVAREIGAIFVDRDDPHGRARAALALTRCDSHIVVFPEGTTRGERLPADFSPGLFRLLRRIDVPLIPVTIRYGDRRAYWLDDGTLAHHLWTHTLNGPRIAAAVHIGDPLPAARRCDSPGLARAAYDSVCEPIEEFGEVTRVVRPDATPPCGLTSGPPPGDRPPSHDFQD